MSWDNKQGPWGKEQRPPEIDELLEKVQERVRNLFGGKRFATIGLLVIVVVLLWLATGIYQVNQDQVGVVQRFGKYSRTVGPGLQWKLPSGIEKVSKVATQRIYQEEFGLRTLRAGVRTEYAPESQYERESLMLTGDLNCVLVPWVVRYRIGDPYKFLFRIRNVRETLRSLSEATMRTVVGDHSLDEVLNKRELVASLTQERLQEALDGAESGLFITTIELGKTNVPEPVQPSFNEVNAAIQEKEKLIYQAQGAYNKVIPEARGKAEKMIQEAEGFAVNRVKRAQGDVARFLALYDEYLKAKEITRKRLYLEALDEMLPRLGRKYVIDAEQKGFLPLLNLGERGDKP
ncbi:MAG: FtsH protease activity modulator HflK [Thermodesulfobacteriota bacterium]